jgi:hypothetical protein
MLLSRSETFASSRETCSAARIHQNSHPLPLSRSLSGSASRFCGGGLSGNYFTSRASMQGQSIAGPDSTARSTALLAAHLGGRHGRAACRWLVTLAACSRARPAAHKNPLVAESFRLSSPSLVGHEW